jgi:hypothetical protein
MRSLHENEWSARLGDRRRRVLPPETGTEKRSEHSAAPHRNGSHDMLK